MGRLQCAAQWHSNPMAWAHSTDAALSGPRWPSALAAFTRRVQCVCVAATLIARTGDRRLGAG
jgi:hypothetical protein